jgi:hypothetical protein
MAAALFPKWVDSWDGIQWMYPNLPGYQYLNGINWLTAPYLNLVEHDHKMHLCVNYAGVPGVRFSSPTVRELDEQEIAIAA